MAREVLQKPYDIYKTYVAVKIHFTSHYDFINSYGKTNANVDSYLKRKDKKFFECMCFMLKKELTVPFFVAQMVDCHEVWVGDIVKEPILSQRIFDKWKSRVRNIESNYQKDMETILGYIKKGKSLLEYEEGDHPLLTKLLVNGHITPETYTLLDDVLFHLEYDEKSPCSELFSGINFKHKKYRRFLKITSEKVKEWTPKEILGQINKNKSTPKVP